MYEPESEPKLEDVLSDPMIRALMARDRIDAEDLRALVRHLGQAQATRPPGEAKAAAAHQWMTTLHERGRSLGLRYTARSP
jgi:hypothetical protein